MKPCVSLLVRLWVEITIATYLMKTARVSLLVRLWVEIKMVKKRFYIVHCQPPREAVSWNNKKGVEVEQDRGQPPREAVSWNNKKEIETLPVTSQPSREAVSWNTKFFDLYFVFSWQCSVECCIISIVVEKW